MPIIRHDRRVDRRMRPVGAPQQPLRIGAQQRVVKRPRIGVVGKSRPTAGRAPTALRRRAPRRPGGPMPESTDRRRHARPGCSACDRPPPASRRKSRAASRRRPAAGASRTTPASPCRARASPAGTPRTRRARRRAHSRACRPWKTGGSAGRAGRAGATRAARPAPIRVSVMATPRKRLRETFERIAHDAVVVAVRVALHDHAMREAEMIEQRAILLHRRVRRRVAAAGCERELLRRTEDVRVGVPGAGRRRDGGPARRRDRPGDERRRARCVSRP